MERRSDESPSSPVIVVQSAESSSVSARFEFGDARHTNAAAAVNANVNALRCSLERSRSAHVVSHPSAGSMPQPDCFLQQQLIINNKISKLRADAQGGGGSYTSLSVNAGSAMGDDCAASLSYDASPVHERRPVEAFDDSSARCCEPQTLHASCPALLERAATCRPWRPKVDAHWQRGRPSKALMLRQTSGSEQALSNPLHSKQLQLALHIKGNNVRRMLPGARHTVSEIRMPPCSATYSEGNLTAQCFKKQ